MLTEMVVYGCKIEERVKAMKSELKENAQGTNSEGKEIRNQINGLEKEEINIQPEQNEETRIQKKPKRGLGTLQDNFKCSNIQIIGVPEGEEETYLNK